MLVIAGSVGKTGAAVLAASGGAARRSRTRDPGHARSRRSPSCRGCGPEVMAEPLAATGPGRSPRRGLDRALALAASRAMPWCSGRVSGRTPRPATSCASFVARCARAPRRGRRRVERPRPRRGPRRARRAHPPRPVPTVLTPHPGEMARLVSTDGRRRCRARRLETAREPSRNARGPGGVLKGQRTLVASRRAGWP